LEREKELSGKLPGCKRDSISIEESLHGGQREKYEAQFWAKGRGESLNKKNNQLGVEREIQPARRKHMANVNTFLKPKKGGH